MKPEKIDLIHDLIDNERDARREATFLAGGRILRRRRFRRATMQAFAVVMLLGIATVSIQKITSVPRQLTTTASEPPAQLRSLTDEELLALFPETPVGLVTLENGKKRLIFPQPGDEAQFITRL